jgi:hypothetical protein
LEELTPYFKTESQDSNPLGKTVFTSNPWISS